MVYFHENTPRNEYENTPRNEYGNLIYAEIIIKPTKQKMSLNARAIYFKTDTYNARLYTSERDVLYQSNLQMFQNKGWRWYFNLKLRILPQVDIYLRYSNSHYLNASSIGSADDEILGANKSE